MSNLSKLISCFSSPHAWISILQDYLPKCRPKEGVCHLDGGQDMYKICLRYHLSLEMHPKEVHEIGLREVKRIKGEMVKVCMSLIPMHAFLLSPHHTVANRVIDTCWQLTTYSQVDFVVLTINDHCLSHYTSLSLEYVHHILALNWWFKQQYSFINETSSIRPQEWKQVFSLM